MDKMPSEQAIEELEYLKASGVMPFTVDFGKRLITDECVDIAIQAIKENQKLKKENKKLKNKIASLGNDMRAVDREIMSEECLVGFSLALALTNKHLGDINE